MTTKSELFKNLSPKKRNIHHKLMIRSKSNLEPILNKKQKLFGVYKPVKNFHRFGKEIMTNSGINPDAVYVRFYEREITQPYKKSNFIIEEKKYIPDYPLKWSLGYSCKCNKPYLIPKQQQFTVYKFSNKLSKENNVHSTDNIFNSNYNIENDKNYKNEKFPFLDMKKKFYGLSNSKEWIPRIYDNFSNTNKSNVDYNIITNIPKENYEKVHLPEMIKNKKRKGIADYSEQLMPFYPKFREDYSKLLDENNNIFRRYNGIFSSMYDSSAKNGNIYKPFKRGSSIEN